ncbi:MAG: PEP-CTERM sorting domain-containing protein, partial [Planctomycetes bacterium]|nr:PEP-CTERM sorting domain-containing protein [Planctomycetota bacterium]
YRTGITDNLWYADTIAFDGWWAIQWDQNFQASSYFFDFGVPVSAGIWQHVKYTIDTAGGTSTVEIAGVGSFSSSQPDTTINGIDLEVEPTESGGADGPTYIDNLRMVETPEPASLLLAGLGVLFIRRPR